MFDTVAFDGLRGWLSLYICVFHSLLQWDGPSVDLQGSAQMPAFFLLSGFVMALSEGSKQRKRPTCCGRQDFMQITGIEDPRGPDPFPVWVFYRKYGLTTCACPLLL